MATMASSLRRQELSETSPKASPARADEDKDGSITGSSPKPRSASPDASPVRSSPKSLSGPPPLISYEDKEKEPGEKIPNETDKSSVDLRNLPHGLRLPMVPPHMNPFGPLPFFNMSPSMQDIMARKDEGEKDSGASSLGMPLPGTAPVNTSTQSAGVNGVPVSGAGGSQAAGAGT